MALERFEIKNRFTGAVQVTAEIECEADASYSVKLGLAVKWAFKARANLAGADLAGADLARADLAGANLAGADLAGTDLARANLAGAKGIRDVLSIGPIGSRMDYLQALRTDDGIVIHTGCFSGTLAAFESAVAERHGDNEHGQHYRLAIALIVAKIGGAA